VPDRVKLHDPVIDLLRNAHFALLLGSALATALASCTTKTQPPTDTSPGGNSPQPGAMPPSSNDAGATTPTASTCGFVTAPTSFALPAIAGAPLAPFDAIIGTVACAAGANKLKYTLLDLDADGRLDLVVTSTCDDATIGVSAWLVYFGSAGGFAATATRFSLPPASPAGCATVSIFDTDGDLLPDYVVTSLCSDATVGTSRWLVYSNSSAHTGFAPTVGQYTLPPGGTAGAFAATGVTTPTCTNGANQPAFQLLDINGDGKLDFVVTQACDDATVGTTSWRVYLGTASGAAATPTSLVLPTSPPFTTGAFAETYGTLTCSATVSKPTFGLLDFDADGRPDLIVTQSCNDAALGTSSWLLFHNGGAAFAASTTIALPTIPSAPTNPFPSLGAAGTCTGTSGPPTYSILDVNGDALPDLLVTGDCDDALTGSTYWQLFANTGAGFASPYAPFSLPSVLGATLQAPAALSGTEACTVTPARPTFTTTYLAGLTLDVVVTTDCSDTTVGESKWLLFPASCK
jgi:hypothetical protein